MSEIPDYVRGPGLRRPHRVPPPSSSGHPPEPCPWPECRCTHTDGCVRGWIDADEEEPEIGENGRPRTRPDGTVITHLITKPCPRCRPEAAEALNDPMLTHGQQLAKIRRRKER